MNCRNGFICRTLQMVCIWATEWITNTWQWNGTNRLDRSYLITLQTKELFPVHKWRPSLKKHYIWKSNIEDRNTQDNVWINFIMKRGGGFLMIFKQIPEYFQSKYEYVQCRYIRPYIFFIDVSNIWIP